jgi:ATP-dependent Clp protease ATP-binding subunit ClpA
MSMVFDKMTEDVLRTFAAAQDERRFYRRGQFDAEFLLLALVRQDQDKTARILCKAGVTSEAIRKSSFFVDESHRLPEDRLPVAVVPTESADHVISGAWTIAVELGDSQIELEHLALALIAESCPPGTFGLFAELGVDVEALRSAFLDSRQSSP